MSDIKTDSGCHIGYCSCSNVPPNQLQCREDETEHFSYERKGSSEEMTLTCSLNSSRLVLSELEKVGVVGEPYSIKLIGCSTFNDPKVQKYCTPKKYEFFERIGSLFKHFFSFDFTYEKVDNPIEAHIVGCKDMEDQITLKRIKTMMKSEALVLFNFEGEITMKVLKNYLYYGHEERINVDMSEKSISRVEKEVFWTKENLYIIDMLNLSKNRITKIPLEFFPNSTFSNTKYVDLSENDLTSLEKNIFENLTAVEDLILAGNRLKDLPAEIFANNPLERLDLSRNQLITLDAAILENVLNLETLDLSNNYLQAYRLRSNNNFRRLDTLNLANNALTELDEEWKSSYPELRRLNISNNNIGPVLFENNLQFRKSYVGMVLDLSFNNIETLELKEDVIEVDTFFSSDNGSFSDESVSENFQTIILEIKGNPLRCDCRATELKQKLEGRRLDLEYFSMLSQKVQCSSGAFLSHIPDEDLTCPLEDIYPDKNCSYYGCECTINRCYGDQVTINCSAAGLKEFPRELLEMQENNHKIKLDLSNNIISEFPNLSNSSFLENIKYLDFSGNKIKEINHEVLPRNLEYISLSNNEIRSISIENVKYFSEFTKPNFHMQLGQNPYDCNCNAKHLLNFLDSSNGNMVDDDHDVFVSCSSGPMHIYKSEMKDFCIESNNKLTIFLSLIAIIATIIAIYLRYKQMILIYLYSKKWSRIFFHEDFVDKDKSYDVFISYSHADSDFVENTLLTGLEESQEFQYKVCVHSRDWNVGEDIPTQIFRSVRDSRRTVIVLSSKYLESQWSDMEFKAAHKKALKDKIQRLIIIKHGEIPLEHELLKDLQNYIKMNTYLDSSDPWFWPKLRYTLPHGMKSSATFWSASGKACKECC